VLAGTAGLGALAVFYGWLVRPIALQWVPYTDARSHVSLASPFRVDGAGSARPLCRGADGTDALVANEWLYFRARVGRAGAHGAYHVAAVGIVEGSLPRVYVPDGGEQGCGRSPVQAGQVWCYRVRTTQRPEVNAIVLLARRLSPFDGDELQRRFNERFASAGGSGANPLNVTAARNFLEGLAPGSTSRVFRTVPAGAHCQ
jgi:hypothetical protein